MTTTVMKPEKTQTLNSPLIPPRIRSTISRHMSRCLSVGCFVYTEVLQTKTLTHVLIVNEKRKKRTSGASTSNSTQDDPNSCVVKRSYLTQVNCNVASSMVIDKFGEYVRAFWHCCQVNFTRKDKFYKPKRAHMCWSSMTSARCEPDVRARATALRMTPTPVSSSAVT